MLGGTSLKRIDHHNVGSFLCSSNRPIWCIVKSQLISFTGIEQNEVAVRRISIVVPSNSQGSTQSITQVRFADAGIVFVPRELALVFEKYSPQSII